MYDRRFNNSSDHAIGLWTKLWRHCRSRGARLWRCGNELPDLLFVSCQEEIDYARRLEYTVGALHALECWPIRRGLQILSVISVHIAT